MGSRMGLIGCLIIVVAIVLQLRGATAETVYTVGDSLGWAVPPNTSYYSTWATTNLQTFLLGDSLEFNWTATHTVAEVSEADYNNCTKVSSVTASPFKFTPPTAGSYYIICTVDDHCEQGQKFSFNVKGSPAEPPSSSASSLSVGALFAIMATTFFLLSIYFLAYL